MDKIAVFAFTRADENRNANAHVPRKATREAIDRIGATIIEASMEEVEPSDLDLEGFYPRRRAN